MKLPLLLFAFAALSSPSVAGDKTKLFPSENWLAWPHIEVPERFVPHPSSFGGEGQKWWARLDDPDSKLQVEIFAYGYISNFELMLTAPGVTWENYQEQAESVEKLIATKALHQTAGSYFRAKIVPKESEESRIHGYERFIHRKPDGVAVYFLNARAYHQQDGWLYQQLSFTFPEGRASEHQEAIDAIIASAKPSFHPGPEGDDEKK